MIRDIKYDGLIPNISIKLSHNCKEWLVVVFIAVILGYITFKNKGIAPIRLIIGSIIIIITGILILGGK